MTTEQIIEESARMELQKIEITYGMNGYPERLGDVGIIGFENMDSASAFAKEYGLQTHCFKKRDGWQFWETTGTFYISYTSDDLLKDLGDNYQYADSDHSFYAEQLAEIAKRFDGDFTELEAKIKDIKEIIEAVAGCKDDEIVIVTNGKYYETVSQSFMSYHEDVWSYAIGVLIPYDYEPIE